MAVDEELFSVFLIPTAWREAVSKKGGDVESKEKERERQREVWQQLLNWSFDWTHRDGLNVISDWPEARSPTGDVRVRFEGCRG